MSKEETLNLFAKKRGNEQARFLGSLVVLISICGYLRITDLLAAFIGSEIPHVPQYSYLVGTGIGVGLFVYGIELAKTREKALEDRRSKDRPKKELTPGDEIFLERFRGAGGRMTNKQMEEFVTPHDKDKTKVELLTTIAFKRADDLQDVGKMVLYGGVWYTREEFDRTDRTIIGSPE